MRERAIPFPNVGAADLERERRSTEIRRQAEAHGQASARGIRPPGAPFPKASPETGYYGIPLLKPQWTDSIPVYLFVGGAAGAAAVVSAIAHYVDAERKLVSDARWIVAAGGVISPALLIADLGRPERFLHMLRVFKPQSPMSVGAWTLVGFSSAVSAATFAGLLRERYGPSFPLAMIENASEAATIPLGLGLATYTGVLIGATAIPVWNQDPLKHGTSGVITRMGGALSEPIPTALRLVSMFRRGGRTASFRRWAAISAVAGSLLTRMAWLRAGVASARDWRQPLEISPEAKSWPDKHPGFHHPSTKLAC